MTQLKLSIIIPIYNVEEYLERCVNSLTNQNVLTSTYEIILINDGSPDNSLAIAEKLKSENDNIVLISKENGGLSSARNAGLFVAKGEYVWFVDSDDWINKNCLEKLIGLLSNNMDVLAFNSIISKPGQKDVLSQRNNRLRSNELITGYHLFKYGFTHPYSGVQFYFFKRNFLFENNLVFEHGIIYEDILFTPVALSLANKCMYINLEVYHYFYNSESITNISVKFKNISDMLTVADKLNNFSAQFLLSKPQKWIIYKAISLIIGACFRIIPLLEERKKGIDAFSVRKFWLKSIFKSHSYKHVFLYLGIKCNFFPKF